MLAAQQHRPLVILCRSCSLLYSQRYVNYCRQNKIRAKTSLKISKKKIQIFIKSQRSSTNSIDFKHILCYFLSAGSRYTEGKTPLIYSQPDLSCTYKISNFCSASKTCIMHEPSTGTKPKTLSNKTTGIVLFCFFFAIGVKG